MSSWSKLPTWWVRDHSKHFFPGGKSAGASIAGLKCLLAIALSADYYSLESKKSITELEAMTSLSRPMVIKGIRHLETNGLIKVNKSEHVHRYTLVASCQAERDKDLGWAKIPRTKILKELPLFLNRGAVALESLKTYVCLLSRRPNQSSVVSCSYEIILIHTNGQRSNLRKAIDLLVGHGLIKSDSAIDMKSANVYTLLGIQTAPSPNDFLV